jgi:hypothetical protein
MRGRTRANWPPHGTARVSGHTLGPYLGLVAFPIHLWCSWSLFYEKLMWYFLFKLYEFIKVPEHIKYKIEGFCLPGIK